MNREFKLIKSLGDQWCEVWDQYLDHKFKTGERSKELKQRLKTIENEISEAITYYEGRKIF